MSLTRIRSLGGISPLLVAVALLSCKDATAPLVATTMIAVSPTAQTALAGTAVASVPTVAVADQNGNPLAGVTVDFAVIAGGGAIEGSRATTDARGQAHPTQWTLGSVGGENTVSATTAGLSTTFTAVARAAATITPLSLLSQSALVGTVVASAPAVAVADQNGSPLAGVPVTFTVTAGGGSVSGSPVITDARGEARVVQWTLGSAGGTNTLTATVAALSTSFTAVGRAVSRIEAMTAVAQNGVVGSAVAEAPSVRVLDQFDAPLEGIAVTFTPAQGSGSAIGGSTVTNASGIATVGGWTLGTVAGAQSLTATAGTATSTFAVTVAAGPPTRITYVSGSSQTATIQTALAQPFVARVADRYDNVVTGASVQFAVTVAPGPGATLSAASASTGAGGIAQTLLSVGDSAGTYEVAATITGVQGSTAIFTALGDWRYLRATSVTGDYNHFCAAGVDGKSYCWGENTQGEIGDGTFVNRAIATVVDTSFHLTRPTAFGQSTCALTDAGAAYCWGVNNYGELGTGMLAGSPSTATPAPVSGGLAFRSLSAGATFMCGVTTSDAGYCWGNNYSGQLGNGAAPRSSPVPVPVAGNLRFQSISSGWQVACGLTISGSVYCWGSDMIDTTHYGTLGGGDTVTSAPVPRPIAGGRAYTALSVGGFEACALAEDGQVYCWGMGRLGTTDLSVSNVPTAVAGGRTFTRLLGGYSYFCAYTADDVGYCWGGGRFAPDRFDIYVTPTAVPQLPVLSSRASPMNNGDFACLVEKSSSQVYCWGNNSTGAMGDGSMTSFKKTLSKVRAP